MPCYTELWPVKICLPFPLIILASAFALSLSCHIIALNVGKIKLSLNYTSPINSFSHYLVLLVSSRSAWGDDLCSFDPRHSDLRPSDDVLNHPPNRLLHCVDLWRRHHAHAVLHEHTVRLAICFFACVSSPLLNVFCPNHRHYFFLSQGGRGLWSRHLCK